MGGEDDAVSGVKTDSPAGVITLGIRHCQDMGWINRGRIVNCNLDFLW